MAWCLSPQLSTIASLRLQYRGITTNFGGDTAASDMWIVAGSFTSGIIQAFIGGQRDLNDIKVGSGAVTALIRVRG